MQERHSSARRSIIRDALIYTPLFLAVLAAWGAALTTVLKGHGGGGIVLLVVVSFMALLLGFQSIQSLRDLRSQPIVTKGEVLRKWRRAELLVFPTHYVYVNRSMFRVAPLVYQQLQTGDRVAVRHYRHTATVVSIERVQQRESGGLGSGATA